MGGERTKAQHDVLIAGSQPADTQETLRQKRDITSAILDTAGVLIVVLDRERRIVRFNQAPERTTGYSQEEVAGKCVWDLFLLPQERESVQAVFFQLRAGAYSNEFENYWVTRDGERRLIKSWDWDIRTGDLRWSEQIEPMFGFGQGEFGATYEAFLDCVHPEDREYAVDQVVDLLVQLPVPVAHAGSFFRPDR